MHKLTQCSLGLSCVGRGKKIDRCCWALARWYKKRKAQVTRLMTVRAALLSNFFGIYLVRGLVSEVSYMYHGFPPLKIHLLLTKNILRKERLTNLTEQIAT